MRWGILKEYGTFLVQRKKWWLIPIMIIFLLLGLIMIVAETNVITPVIYALF